MPSRAPLPFLSRDPENSNQPYQRSLDQSAPHGSWLALVCPAPLPMQACIGHSGPFNSAEPSSSGQLQDTATCCHCITRHPPLEPWNLKHKPHTHVSCLHPIPPGPFRTDPITSEAQQVELACRELDRLGSCCARHVRQLPQRHRNGPSPLPGNSNGALGGMQAMPSPAPASFRRLCNADSHESLRTSLWAPTRLIDIEANVVDPDAPH